MTSTVTSLLSDLLTAEPNDILAFLEAVDHVMNSNTVLLKARVNPPLMSTTPMNDIFHHYLWPHFTALFLEYDLGRGWYNYHEWDQVGDEVVCKPRVTQIIKPQIHLKFKPMSFLSMAERLHWMLRTSLNPYHPHLDDPTAITLIERFLNATLGEQDGQLARLPTTWIGIPNWVTHPWIFYDITPDFLPSSGYWQKQEPEENPYFDGGRSDSCTLFFKEDLLYLLLTSGSP